MSLLPGLLARLLDDAATFPPGDLPLDRAVCAHLGHRQAPYGDLVGPFVVAARSLDDLAAATRVLRPGALEIALVVPATELGAALERALDLTTVRVAAVEVSLPGSMSPVEAVGLLRRQREGGPWPRGAEDVFVEVPWDERREPLLGALAAAGLSAKLRTGGLSPDAHPGEPELASAVVAAMRARVPFKATAGLHHAVRRTDPGTGSEQHGFLNLLLATAAARSGADTPEVAALLAERDPARVVPGVRHVAPSVRAWFRSFGTCSISDPVGELTALGMLPAGVGA